MKRFWILMLLLTLLAALTACNSPTPEAESTDVPTGTAEISETQLSTEAPTEDITEAVTEIVTEEEEITLPLAEEEATTEWSEPEDVPYDPVVNPVISSKNVKEVKGYNASGEFSFDQGDAISTTSNNMFIATNDRMAHGKLTATFIAPAQDNNDNGIIFGMSDDVYEQYYFWEDGPTYYFLFVADAGTLYLAKVSYNGNAWNILQVSAPIPNYTHGDLVTISVEFDGEGIIDCYANGEWTISYYDDNWTYGDRYGIRCEVPGVLYTEVIADSEYVLE